MVQRITLKDVAKEAEVSATIVSRVLNNYGSFSEETKSKVLKAVEKLNYKPDAIARSLRTKHTKAIGVIISDVVTFFFTNLVRGIEDVASQSDYSVILCNSDEDLVKEREYLSALYERGVDGLIISPSPGNDSYLKKLARGGTPLVLVDRKIRGLKVPTVTVDNETGAYEAVNYLISLRHKRIGIITGLRGVTTSEERLAGYKKALRENKVKIPEEMSIIGFDDPVWAPITNPALTCVSQPSYSIGTLACQSLLKEIKGADRSKTSPEDIILKPKLIIRESCGERIAEEFKVSLSEK